MREGVVQVGNQNLWAGKLALVIAAGVLALAGFSACGGDDDDDTDGSPTSGATAAATEDSDDNGDGAEIEAAVLAAYDAWNAKDIDGLLAIFTEKGVNDVFELDEGTTIAVFREQLPEFIGEPPITSEGFENTEVDGASASTDVAEVQGILLANVQYLLIDDAGVWKIDGQEEIETAVPDGTTLVHVDLNEFAFGVNTNEIADAPGAIAFEAGNVGEQEHELGLARIPADAVVEDLLRIEEDVPGFEFIGGVGPIAAGDTTNMVFTEALEPGRYLMVCFLPDTTAGPEGEPHAFLGMYSEFTIE